MEGNAPRRDDCGDGVLVDHLGRGIFEQHHILVEGFHLTLQLDAIDQIDGNGDMLLTECIQERVL